MFAVVALAVSALALGCGSMGGDPDEANDLARIEAARGAKDRLFRESADSPVPPDRRDELLPLSYFPVAPEYSVPAVLAPATTAQPIIEMPTSTGQLRQMRRVGTLEFRLKDQPLKLSAFADATLETLDRLFVPFTDLTSGTETYSGGRYIDLDRTATGIYILDFNLAYQPYCVYNKSYDCPFPPPENRLPVPVRAGEKLKK